MNIDFRKYIKDPMVIILTILLVFLTCGNIFAALGGRTVTIVLDSAYGGDEPGYAGIVNEAEVTEGVVQELAKLLSNDNRFSVVLTQEDNETKTIEERVNSAEQSGAEIILSIHAEGSGNPYLSGHSNYADSTEVSADKTSLNLAEEISKAFATDAQSVFTGYRFYEALEDGSYQIHNIPESKSADDKTWQMMELSEIPVVISNLCYVTNVDDVNTWAGEAGYQKAAALYYEAIIAWYDTVK